MRFFLFFSSFSYLNLVRFFSPKPQNIEIEFLRKVVELQTQFFLPKFFGPTPLETPLKTVPQKSIFRTAPARAPVFFVDNTRYLRDKYFDIVSGYNPPGTFQMDPPKINFLNGLT